MKRAVKKERPLRSRPVRAVQGLRQGAQRCDLAVLASGLRVQRERLPEVVDGLPVVALTQADAAQAV